MNGEKEQVGWWVISNSALLALLRRAHCGEDPETLIIEEYANSDVERPGDDGSSASMEGN